MEQASLKANLHAVALEISQALTSLAQHPECLTVKRLPTLMQSRELSIIFLIWRRGIS